LAGNLAEIEFAAGNVEERCIGQTKRWRDIAPGTTAVPVANDPVYTYRLYLIAIDCSKMRAFMP